MVGIGWVHGDGLHATTDGCGRRNLATDNRRGTERNPEVLGRRWTARAASGRRGGGNALDLAEGAIPSASRDGIQRVGALLPIPKLALINVVVGQSRRQTRVEGLG